MTSGSKLISSNRLAKAALAVVAKFSLACAAAVVVVGLHLMAPAHARAQDAPAAAAAAAAPAPSTAASSLPDPQTIARNDVQRLARILSDVQAPQDQRDEAARRLISRQSPEARQIVANALVDLNPGGQLAAARGLADDPNPDPALINPLFAALGGSRQLTDAAARALASYKSNPEVLGRLISQVNRRPAIADSVRIPMVRALGSLVEKRSAETLVGLLRNQDESMALHAAAADALADLSGITTFGQDAAQWAQWWAYNADKSEAQFRNDLLPQRSARYDQTRQRVAQLSTEVADILTQQYQSAGAAQRPEILARYLGSSDPEIRAIGARIIEIDALDGRPIPASAREQLRSMIGDSSARVRQQVAAALSPMNDASALEPLLAQLAQENDPQVRAALARAVAPIKDLRAVPVLVAMLDDPSYAASRAAAEALERIGPQVVKDDPALAARVAQALRRTLERQPANSSNAELREALVDAMVPYKQRDLLPMFYGLLKERSGESAEIRRLALKAIGEIGAAESAAVVADALNDREARVRLAAIDALRNMPSAPEYAETLRQRMDIAEEPDASVRDAAWEVLQSCLPNLTKQQLQDYADRFRGTPVRRLITLQALADQLVKDKDEDVLATTRQNIGATLLDDLNEPAKAVEWFRQALEYRKSQPGQSAMVIDSLMNSVERSLLLSKQYPEAIAFAASCITDNPSNQQSMGIAIKTEADRLRDAGDLDNALKLISETGKMKPPLATQYSDKLAEIESDIRKRLNERGGPTGNGTQNAAVSGDALAR